jgi:pre-mRNA cleavage complex 2 protein Pcf11
LYKKLPNQCSTCGKRYNNDAQGHEAREKHLDWHFRVNKRLREDNRAVNRCWYLTEQEWIKYHDEDEILGLVQVEQEKSEKEDRLDIESLGKKYVPVPTDKSISDHCPICKDKFETQWNEEAEDWVWINAIEEKGKYFHAICHAEAQLAKKKDTKEREKKSLHISQDAKDSARNSPAIATPQSLHSQTVTPSSQQPTPASTQPVLPAGLDLASILANASKRKFEGDDERGTKREKSMV